MDEDFSTDWSLISFEDPKKADAVKAAPADYVDGKWIKTCSGCGRVLGKGGHFHVKHCKGAK